MSRPTLTHGLEVLVVVVAIVGKAEGVDVVPLPPRGLALSLLRTALLLRPAISWWLRETGGRPTCLGTISGGGGRRGEGGPVSGGESWGGLL